VHVNVTSYNRMLLLTGEAPSAEIKADIEKLASTACPTSSRSATSWPSPGPPASAAAATTFLHHIQGQGALRRCQQVLRQPCQGGDRAGVVFLLGIVTQGEANDAVDIARTTGGVQKVVRVFEIISAGTRRLDNKPAPAPEPKPAAGK
jgi:hypothetical protein